MITFTQIPYHTRAEIYLPFFERVDDFLQKETQQNSQETQRPIFFQNSPTQIKTDEEVDDSDNLSQILQKLVLDLEEEKQKKKTRYTEEKPSEFKLSGVLKESDYYYTFQGTVPKEITKKDLNIEVKQSQNQQILVIQGSKGFKSFKRQFLIDQPVNIQFVKAKLNQNQELYLQIPKLTDQYGYNKF